jgi:hypothetical protein
MLFIQTNAKELISNWITPFVGKIQGRAADMTCFSLSKMFDLLIHELNIHFF